MSRLKVIFPFLFVVTMITVAYGQQKPVNFQTMIISGTVTGTDYVGNTVSIMTDDQHPMSFFVPGNAIITRDTHDIGLMDLMISNPITIKYSRSTLGKDTAYSIVDNKTDEDESEE